MANRNSRVCFRLRRSFTMGYPVFEIWGPEEEISRHAVEDGDVRVYALPRPAEKIDVDSLLSQLRPLAKAMMRGASREFRCGAMAFRLSSEAAAAEASMACLCRHAPERSGVDAELARLAMRAGQAGAGCRARA